MSETAVVIDPGNLTDSQQTPVKPISKPIDRRGNAELRERCKALYLRGLRPASIAAETGVSAAVIHVWVNRHGWKTLLNSVEATLDKRIAVGLSIQPQPQSDQSNQLRETFGKILQAHASKMAEVPAKADLKTLRKVGKALEPLVRSAKVIHNWGDSNPAGIVLTELLGHEQSPIAAAVDVEQLPCGLDTPTGSVPDQQIQEPDTQSAQPVDSQPVTPSANER